MALTSGSGCKVMITYFPVASGVGGGDRAPAWGSAGQTKKRSHQKKVFMIFVGENLWAKGVQNFSGKFGEIRAKIFHTPKNLPAPTSMPVAVAYTFAPINNFTRISRP